MLAHVSLSTTGWKPHTNFCLMQAMQFDTTLSLGLSGSTVAIFITLMVFNGIRYDCRLLKHKIKAKCFYSLLSTVSEIGMFIVCFSGIRKRISWEIFLDSQPGFFSHCGPLVHGNILSKVDFFKSHFEKLSVGAMACSNVLVYFTILSVLYSLYYILCTILNSLYYIHCTILNSLYYTIVTIVY